MSADNAGFISYIADEETGEKNPVIIDKGKRLVLPTPEQLRSGDFDNRVIFHPLCESAHKGESEIVTKLRTRISNRLNSTIYALLVHFVHLALNKDKHDRLNPNQAVVLSLLKEADQQLIQNLESIARHSIAQNTGPVFVKIYLRRSGMVNGKSVARAAIVSFPFYEELIKEGTSPVYGVKLRKKDKILLVALFEYIFPGININGAYDRGSLSNVAPFLDALTQAVANIIGCITAQVDNYQNFFSDPQSMLIEAEWEEAFQCLGELLPQIRSIPPQLLSEGSVKVADIQAQQATGTSISTVTPGMTYTNQTPTPSAPVTMPDIGNTSAPSLPRHGNSQSLRDFLGQRMPQQQPQQPIMNPHGNQFQPQFGFQQPNFMISYQSNSGL